MSAVASYPAIRPDAEAMESLLPRRIIIENSEKLWKRDLKGALAARGYRLLARSRLNSVYKR